MDDPGQGALRQMVFVDHLTGAYSRRYADASIRSEFGRRAEDGRPFAVLLIDIDRFKVVNDSIGFEVGDRMLVVLVQACRDTLRPVDVVMRMGGDEFLVLLPETDMIAAVSAAERLRAALARTEVVAPDGTAVRFTVSVGVASPTSEDPRDLLDRVDAAMYAAKRAGGNQIALAP